MALEHRTAGADAEGMGRVRDVWVSVSGARPGPTGEGGGELTALPVSSRVRDAPRQTLTSPTDARAQAPVARRPHLSREQAPGAQERTGRPGGVRALEWTLQTDLGPGRIRSAGRRASAGGPFDGLVRENLARKGRVSYSVVDPASLATVMSLEVSWVEALAGRRDVTLRVTGHVVRRTWRLGHPLVGRSIPALGPAAHFSAALRRGLDNP